MFIFAGIPLVLFVVRDLVMFRIEQAVCQCQVVASVDGDERIVAIAQGTITKVEKT